jgi:hypothetical protein
LLQSREFEKLDAKDRAALMTKKAMAIRSDYITMQQMVKEHSGMLIN